MNTSFQELRIVLAAGGTGGHLFPAQALAEKLQERGHHVYLMTDERAERYGVKFPARSIHIVRSGTVQKHNVLQYAKTFGQLGLGVWESLRILRRIKPHLVIGFGGYPTVPPLMAASFLKIPLVLHEQNAVAGRANAMLAGRASCIAVSFERTRGFDDHLPKCVWTGNPVRQSILDHASYPYTMSQAGQPFNLVVFGGSQGARFFSQIMPKALQLMPETLRARLQITQQCRPEDLAIVREAYEDMALKANLGSFFVNLVDYMSDAHLIIARSGASTVAELGILGRPSILVPFPHSLDQDQAMNARILEEDGGALVLEQDTITPEKMADCIKTLMQQPEALASMARTTQKSGRKNAVQDLADVVERMAKAR
jgi:UDP-N-acetylglucosamine--N-acetylmuramyl-(pentapeptide) pyrophosphoryl-undecaprenol N-acetylglucosamine transferase